MPQYAGLVDHELRLEGAFDPAALVIEGWFDPDLIPGTLPVSPATALFPYEGQVGLVATVSEAYEAPAGAGIVTNTADLIWEALQGIAQSTSEPDEAKQGIAGSSAFPWEAKQGIAGTTSESLEALQGIGAAAPSYRSGSHTVTQAATNNINATKPVGLASGDVIIAVVSAYAGGSHQLSSPPAGFTQIGATQTYRAASDTRAYVFWKGVEDASLEPANYAFLGNGGSTPQWTVHLSAYSGANFRDPISAQSVKKSTNPYSPSTTITGTSITPTASDCLILSIAFARQKAQTTDITQPAGYASEWEYANASTAVRDESASAAQQVAAATGDLAWTGLAGSNPSESSLVWTLALAPSGSVATSPDESLMHPADDVCSYRGNGSLVRQDAGSLSIQPASPATLQDGDLVFLLLAFAASITSLVVPAGFALVTQQGNDYIYAKIADGEPATYFVSWATARNASAISFAYSGTDGIEDIVVTSDPGLAVNHTTGTLNVQRPNEGLLIIARSFDTNLNQDPSAGFVERFDYGNTAGQFLPWELQDKLAASAAGTKGTFTYQGAAGFSSTNRTYLISIRAHRGATARTGVDVGGGLTPAQTSELPLDAKQALTKTGSEPWSAVDGASVRQTSQFVWEALLGIARSSSFPWELPPSVLAIAALEYEDLQALAKTGSQPWSAVDGASVRQTVALALEALLGRRSTASLPWEVPPGVLALAAMEYESLRSLAKTVSLPWEVPPGVLALASLAYEALKVIAKTGGEPWENIDSSLRVSALFPWESRDASHINALAALIYEASKKNARTAIFPWTTKPGLKITALYPWETQKGHKHPQTAEAKVAWEALILRKQSNSRPWEARGFVTPAPTARLPWESRAVITTATAMLAYETLVRHVRRPTDSPWEALQRLKRDDVGFPWEATGTPPPRIHGLALMVIDAVQALASSFAAPWSSIKPLRSTASLPWDVPPGVMALAAIAYESMQALRSTPGAPIEWEGRIHVGQSAALVWEALAGILDDLEFPWEAGAETGAVLSDVVLPIDTVVAASASQQAAWEALAGRLKMVGLPWEATLTSLIRLLEFPWDATGSAGATIEWPWEAGGRSGASASLPYEVVARLARLGIFPIEWRRGIHPGFGVSAIVAAAASESGDVSAFAVEGSPLAGAASEAELLARYIALAAVIAAFASTISDEEAGKP